MKVGPDDPAWSPFDAALLRAVDELHDDSTISDATWATLAERYSTEQMLDVVFTVGHYHLVSMALNSCGVRARRRHPRHALTQRRHLAASQRVNGV